MSPTARAVYALGLLTLAFAAGWFAGSGKGPSLSPEMLAQNVREGLANPSTLEGSVQILESLEQLGRENLEAVRAVYEERIEGLEECEAMNFASAWAGFDPQGAFDAVQGDRWRFSGRLQPGAGAVVETWAMRDPLAARQLLEEVRETKPWLFEQLVDDLVGGWVKSGDPGFGDYLRTLPRDTLQQDALTMALGTLIRTRGVEGVFRWVREFIPSLEPRDQEKLFRKSVYTAALRRPDLAEEWILEHYGRPYASDGPKTYASARVTLAPNETFEWIRSRAPEESRAEAVSQAFRYWLAPQPGAAAEWLESRPRDAFYDPAIVVFVRNLAKWSPEDVGDWCERCVGEEARGTCLNIVARKAARERSNQPAAGASPDAQLPAPQRTPR